MLSNQLEDAVRQLIQTVSCCQPAPRPDSFCLQVPSGSGARSGVMPINAARLSLILPQVEPFPCLCRGRGSRELQEAELNTVGLHSHDAVCSLIALPRHISLTDRFRSTRSPCACLIGSPAASDRSELQNVQEFRLCILTVDKVTACTACCSGLRPLRCPATERECVISAEFSLNGPHARQ